MRQRLANSMRLSTAYLAGFYLTAGAAMLALRVEGIRGGRMWITLLVAPLLAMFAAVAASYRLLGRSREPLAVPGFLAVWANFCWATAGLFLLLAWAVVGWTATWRWGRAVGPGFWAIYLLIAPAVGCLAARQWRKTLRRAEKEHVERSAMEAELLEADENYHRAAALPPESPVVSTPALEASHATLENLRQVLEARGPAWADMHVRVHWQLARVDCALGRYADAAGQLEEMTQAMQLVRRWPDGAEADYRQKRDRLVEEVARLARGAEAEP